MKKQPKDKLSIYKRKLRKHENILIVSGIAVFAFAVWDLVKMVRYLTLDNSFFEDFPIMQPLNFLYRQDLLQLREFLLILLMQMLCIFFLRQ